MARKLSDLEVHNVKLLICEGFSQIDVARALDISQGSVSRICLGDAHRDIPWPNPDIGEKLMRARGVRSQRDMVQAQLASGLAEPSIRQLPEPAQVIQSNEQDAVEQARQEVTERAAMRKEIFRRAAILEKEEQESFKALFKSPPGAKPDPSDPRAMASIWEVSFLPWEEVLERAGDIDLVKALEDGGDDLTKRAIGIVFYTMQEENWSGDQALRLVSSIVKQLEALPPGEVSPIDGK